MAGKYVIKTTDSGKFRFNLKAGNGEIIAESQMYASIRSCKKGIESVRRNAAAANIEDQTVEPVVKASCPKFEVYTDKAGEFRFRLTARNGEIIATGEGYKAQPSCLNGIESIRKNSDSDVEIVK
ncbi:MAG: YegP family protein [Clostridia bacterium]|nr:YegP family protein [Clostridia bacterium]